MLQIIYIQELYLKLFMSDSQASHSNGDRSNHNQEIANKLFITNLDGNASQQSLKDSLRTLFEKYGNIENLVVKKSRNSEYSFAFIEYKAGEDASAAVKNLNRQQVNGKEIKVELQDNAKRRKDSQTGCYICGKKGHFARQCRSKNQYGRSRRRSMSRSSSEPRKKHKKHRRRSDSSDRDRSRTPKKKKQKKYRSKDRDEKKKKKDKKRYRDSSEN